MNREKEEEQKRELQKLLREYDANRGMAALVCGRPIMLMPKEEQDRIIKGFCTSDNLEIIATSIRKLELARSLKLDESEAEKINTAIPTLDGILKAFTEYVHSSISLDELREKVGKIIYRPIPESQEGLIDSLSHLIETLIFLTTQPLDSKDNWERMVDCVQTHDALSRAKEVCAALQLLTANEENQIIKRSEAIDDTTSLVETSLYYLENFFKGELQITDLQSHFVSLAEGLKDIWTEE